MAAGTGTDKRLAADEEEDGFVADYLLYLMAVASNAASSEFHAEVRAKGIRVPEWRVLACLNDRDGQMVTQLAKLALMEQSRMTKIIDQMALKDLLYREGDLKDRRRVRVMLTPEGRAVASELVSAARFHEQRILDRLPAGSARQLKEALKEINALYEAEGAIDRDDA